MINGLPRHQTLRQGLHGSLIRLSLLPLVLSSVLMLASQRDAEAGHIAQTVQIPLYLPPDSTPAAILRIADIRVEYALHGFFRIGLLPELIVQDVTLEVRNGPRIEGLLKWLQRQIAGRIGDAPIRIRGVCVRGDYEGRRIIAAARLDDLDSSQWVFSDGTWSVDGRDFFRFDRATLTVQGPDFGKLTLRPAFEVTEVQFLQPSDSDPRSPQDP